MDLQSLTNDEFVDHFGEVLREAERRVQAHSEQSVRSAVGDALTRVHRRLVHARDILAIGGIVRPFSGGEPK